MEYIFLVAKYLTFTSQVTFLVGKVSADIFNLFPDRPVFAQTKRYAVF